MFPWESRRTRPSGRERRRPDLAALECLEDRQLMAYSVLGSTLPQFAISGFASPAASWGQQITVTVDIANINASSILEPTALAPGVPITPGDVPPTSSADAPRSTVGVFASKTPDLKGAVFIGAVGVPALGQNNLLQITKTIKLPNRPAGFPGDGGKIYLAFEADATNRVYQSSPGHAVSAPIPVNIEAPFPELRTVGFDTPPVMQPGDTIQANVRITNLGTVNTGPQGVVQVGLFESPTKFITSSSRLLRVINVVNPSGLATSIPGISAIATSSRLLGDANQTPPKNVVTVAFPDVTLPRTPGTYYLGVVIDPFKHIKQLSRVAGEPVFNNFELPRKVGPPIKNLPPATAVLVPGGATIVPTFPFALNNRTVGGPRGSTLIDTTTGLPITPIATQPFPPAVPIAPI